MTAPSWPEIQWAKSRALIVLVVDTSESMLADRAIDVLNSALRTWREDLDAAYHLRRVAEIAMVTFGAGGVRVVRAPGDESPFVPIDRFRPPTLTAAGFSPIVPAIRAALSVAKERKAELQAAGISMAYTPLIYLMTDGEPSEDDGTRSDKWRDLAPELRRQEANGDMLFFAFGVRRANPEVLRTLAPTRNYRVDSDDFAKVVRAVGDSVLRQTSGARQQGGQPDVDPHAAARDWFAQQQSAG